MPEENQTIEKMNLADVPAKEIIPGYHGKMIHTPTMTFAYWDIEPDHDIPIHSHVNEQVVNMLEGEFELVVAGHPHRLKAGDILIIPPNVPHGGRAITPTKILDVFNPVREDYRQ